MCPCVVTSRDGSEGRAGRVAAGGLTTTHTRLSVYVLRKYTDDASYLLEATSQARRSSKNHGLICGGLYRFSSLANLTSELSSKV